MVRAPEPAAYSRAPARRRRFPACRKSSFLQGISCERSAHTSPTNRAFSRFAYIKSRIGERVVGNCRCSGVCAWRRRMRLAPQIAPYSRFVHENEGVSDRRKIIE